MTARIPSYLEAFQKDAKNRDSVKGFLNDMRRSQLVPQRIDTGFFGITVDKDNVFEKLLEFVASAPDPVLAQIVDMGKKWFK